LKLKIAFHFWDELIPLLKEHIQMIYLPLPLGEGWGEGLREHIFGFQRRINRKLASLFKVMLEYCFQC